MGVTGDLLQWRPSSPPEPAKPPPEPAKPPPDYPGKNQIWDAIASAIANEAAWDRQNAENVRRMLGAN